MLFAYVLTIVLLCASRAVAGDGDSASIFSRVNWNGITFDSSLTWQDCMVPGAHCIRQLSRFSDYNVSALDMADAQCVKQMDASDGSGTVSTGTCHVLDDNDKGTTSFLVQCMTGASAGESYVVIDFQANSTSFTAYGNALACLENGPARSTTGLKSQGQLDKSGVDASVWCPRK